MEDRDREALLRHAEIIEAVREAVRPYEGEVRELRQIKESAERAAAFAKEDRERLIKDMERQAREAAEKEIAEVFERLGINIKNPELFLARMRWLTEWMDAIGTAKKHTMTVFITSIVGGVLLMLWNSFKGQILKP